MTAAGGRRPPALRPFDADRARQTWLSPVTAARLDRLYREYASRLIALVAHTVHRRRDQVEDSCQYAWAVLARRPDVLDGPSVRGWLVTVAVHQYIADARRTPVPVDVIDRRAGLPLDDAVEAREALRMVAALRPVRRRVFERVLAGLTYQEIAAEQGLTYTNVNRQITKSRAELRAAA
jgi:RNA polymerase sigma factor (sigma-70 family)